MNIWVLAPGTPVEARLEYPIPAGSVKHSCWGVGILKTAAVLENGMFGGLVELGNGTTTIECSYEDIGLLLRPPAPQHTYIDTACWPQVLQLGDPVDVMFKGAWCPATVISLQNAPKLLLHGHLHILVGAEVTSLRRSMHWCRSADGMWGWMASEVPSHIRQLLTRKDSRWLNVRQSTEASMHDSSSAVTHSLPPLPTELPSHVTPDMATVPIFEAENVLCSDTGSWATSFIPAVLARLSDVAASSSNAFGNRSTNFTPEQWQAVVAHLGLSEKLVAIIDSLAGFQLCGCKRTHAQAVAEPLGNASDQAHNHSLLDSDDAGNTKEDDTDAQAAKRVSLSRPQAVRSGVGESQAAAAALAASVSAPQVLPQLPSQSHTSATHSASSIGAQHPVMTSSAAAAAAATTAGVAMNPCGSSMPLSQPAQHIAAQVPLPGTSAYVASCTALQLPAVVLPSARKPDHAAVTAHESLGAAPHVGVDAATLQQQGNTAQPAAPQPVQQSLIHAAMPAPAAHVVLMPAAARAASTAAPDSAADVGAAGDAAAAAVADAAATDAAAAASTHAPYYDPLPVGFELHIVLQQPDVDTLYHRFNGQRVYGNAKVQLLKQLGHGGMADAYLGCVHSYEPSGAQPKGSCRPPDRVVVKLVHPPREPLTNDRQRGDFLSNSKFMLWEEYGVLKKVSDCRTVIKAYGFGSAAAGDGSMLYGIASEFGCLLLEWAELGDLMQQLQPSPGQRVPMTAQRTQQVMTDLVWALRTLHFEGYIHRDVKPQNVLVCKVAATFVVNKLSDFGLVASAAREVPDDGDGTRAYKPPEQYWYRSSDTYSLGRLFLACRSAATPPLGASYQELRDSGVYDNLPDPMRDVEWELVELCLRDLGSRPWPSSLCDHTNYFEEFF